MDTDLNCLICSSFWKVTWSVVAPLFLLAIFLVAIFTWEEHKYASVVPYPEWAHIVGWVLVGLSAIQVRQEKLN